MSAEPGHVIDECLSVRSGHLWIEDCDAVELAARFGTPVYVISETQLRTNARRILRAFAGQWPGPVRVLPSIKANHVLALRRILKCPAPLRSVRTLGATTDAAGLGAIGLGIIPLGYYWLRGSPALRRAAWAGSRHHAIQG